MLIIVVPKLFHVMTPTENDNVAYEKKEEAA